MTTPFFPTITNVPLVFDESDYETSEGSDGDLPNFDINLNDESDGDDDDDDVYDPVGDEDEDDDYAVPTGLLGELGQLLNIPKPTGAFPMPTQRAPAQIVIPTPLTTIPRPSTLQLAPQPAAVRPTTLTLTPTLPQTFPTAIPQMTAFPGIPSVAPKIPSLPGITPAPTTLTLTPALPQTFPGVPSTTPKIPSIPGIVQTTLTLNPQAPGLTLTPTQVPVLQPRPAAKTVDVSAILKNMPGITITSVTGAPVTVETDIMDLLKKESDEDPNDFEARKRLTLLLGSIPDYKLNNTTAVTAGMIMMKKSKLGLTYDPDVEAAISYLTALLQRK